MSKQSTNLLPCSSGGQKLPVSLSSNQGAVRPVPLSDGGAGENLLACLLQLLEAAPTLWLVGPSAICKASNRKPSLACSSSLWNSSLLRLEGLSWFTLGAPGSPSIHPASKGQLISNINSICSMNAPLPCNTTHSQFLGIRRWTSLDKGLFCLV